jgi:ParB-like chromosome segregation protein Spo0J
MIIAGHARIKAVRKMGGNKVPVIYVDFSENDAKLYNIADNKLATLAEWDTPKLNEILDEFKELKIDIDVLGFTESDLSKMMIELRYADSIPDTLRAEYVIPPFSILDGRAGYWTKRKRMWRDMLGVHGHEGRDDTIKKVGAALSIFNYQAEGLSCGDTDSLVHK